MRKENKRQVFISGYYGWGNTGDDAMLYVLLQELPKSYPETNFAVLSHVPVVIPASVKDKVRFVRPAVIPALREIIKSQIFIIGGGTHIHDYGRDIRNIKILSRLLIIVTFAKISGNKVYLIGNGVGPVATKWGKALTRAICHMADNITVRDEASYHVLETLSLARANKVSLSFDLAALLVRPQETHSGGAKESVGKKILGICVTSVFEIYYGDKERDLSLINKIARALNQWLKVMPQLQVYLFVFKDGPRDSDVHITELLKERLKPAQRVKLIPYNPDPIQTLAQVAQCSAFVGTKYHSCLFAYLSKIPLLVINYHPKCRALATEIGLPKHAVVSLAEVLNGQVGERLKNLLEHPEDFQAELPTGLARERAKRNFLLGAELRNEH